MEDKRTQGNGGGAQRFGLFSFLFRTGRDHPGPRVDSDLQLAMELSAKELEERELRLREEEAELQQVLQLSLTEK